MKHLLSAALLVTLAIGCRNRTYNAGSESIQGMTVTASQEISFKLGFAQKNGIVHKAYKDIVNPNAYTERLKGVIRIEFPSLTKEQYDLLMAHYGGQNLVPWQPNRAKPYQLVDFLPPKIQALVNRWLYPAGEPEPRIPQGWRNPYTGYDVPVVSIDMNCWTTAYEVLRDWGKPFDQLIGRFAFIGGAEALETFSSPKHHSRKTSLPHAVIMGNDPVARNRDRQVGDLLIIRTKASSMYSIAHAAIWIDDDLYFEKTNSGSDEPMRLALWDDVVSSYKVQDDPDLPMEMDFYTIKGAAEPLPPQSAFTGRPAFETDEPLPEDLRKSIIFSLGVGLGGSFKEYSAARIVEFPLAQDANSGRAFLKGANLVENYIKGKTICWTDGTSRDTYRYELDRNLKLHVLNAAGAEVAAVQGIYREYNHTMDGQQARVYFDFPSGQKTLRLYISNRITYLSHPGVSDTVFTSCAEELPALKNLFRTP